MFGKGKGFAFGRGFHPEGKPLVHAFLTDVFLLSDRACLFFGSTENGERKGKGAGSGNGGKGDEMTGRERMESAGKGRERKGKGRDIFPAEYSREGLERG